jgi:DNA-binding XRE family transcriptional regulator
MTPDPTPAAPTLKSRTQRRHIGDNIRALREIKGWSQSALAASAGVTAENLCRIESGKAFPSMPTLMGICEALNVGPGSIVTFSRRHVEGCSVCHGQGYVWKHHKPGSPLREMP